MGQRSLESLRQEFEAELTTGRYRDLSKEDKERNRLEFAKMLDGIRDQRREAAMQYAKRKGIGAFDAFKSAFLNEAALGMAPAIAGKFSDETRAQMEADRDAAEAANPISSIAGSVAAYAVPTTPAAKIGGGLFRGGKYLSKVAREYVASSRLVSKMYGEAVEESVRKEVMQTGAKAFFDNMVGNVVSTGAVNAAATAASGSNRDYSYREQLENDGVGSSLRRAVAPAFSPLSILGTGAATGLEARYHIKINAEQRRIAEDFRRITGREIPQAILSGDARQNSAWDLANNSPQLRGYVAKVRKQIVYAFDTMIDEVKQASIGRMRSKPKGDVQVEASQLRGNRRFGMKGAATEARRDMQEDLYGYKGQILSQDQTRELGSMFRRAIADKPKLDTRGDDWDGIVNKLIEMTSPDPKTGMIPDLAFDEVEALRRGAARAASYDVPDKAVDRTRYEGDQVYDALNVFMLRHFPEAYLGNMIAQDFHRLDEALQKFKVSEIPEKTFQNFWNTDNPLTRYEYAQRLGSPEFVAGAKEHLFSMLLDKAVSGKARWLDEQNLETALRSPGPTNRAIVDVVLPGAADRLLSLARYGTGPARQGPMKAIGSDTGQRAISTAERAQPYITKMAVIHAFVSGNPNAAVYALGASGVRALIQRSVKRDIMKTGTGFDPVLPGAENAIPGISAAAGTISMGDVVRSGTGQVRGAVGRLMPGRAAVGPQETGIGNNRLGPDQTGIRGGRP